MYTIPSDFEILLSTFIFMRNSSFNITATIHLLFLSLPQPTGIDKTIEYRKNIFFESKYQL